MRRLIAQASSGAVGVALALAGIACLKTVRLDALDARTNPRARLQTVSTTASTPRSVIDRYCLTCHNQRLRTANLALDTIDVERVGENAEVWEKVVRKLRSATMPPVGQPRPDHGTYVALASSLEAALDRAAAAAPNPGRSVVHRLNRAEYANVIRDLLALEIDVDALLPADDTAYGFDNNSDVLGISPHLLERYMSAARKISGLAI